MKLPLSLIDPKQILHFKAGTTIFQAGQEGHEMYVIQKGEVDIIANGKRVDTLETDSFFGEMAIIDHALRSADAIARTDCELLPLNQHRFAFMVDEVPFFAIRVMKVMAERLRRASGSSHGG